LATDKLLELTDLHSQHPGIPASVAGFYAVAAAVCLQRHHTSPRAISVALGDHEDSYQAAWREPDADELRSFGDKTDTTCFGAYTVALAAAFAHLGQKAIGRAGVGTGADWLLLPLDDEVDEWYLENPHLARLEVSGADEADPARLHSRLRQKVRQTQDGSSDVPAYAAVVVFRSASVSFAGAS
jgi:hypothetical protein